jgi:hypothetical protein
MPKSERLDHRQIRERVHAIALGNGYEPMDEEEQVTTGRPPAASGPTQPKKCWNRSFIRNIEAQSDTKAVGDDSSGQRQRMLTTLVCEDSASWWAAFRTAG